MSADVYALAKRAADHLREAGFGKPRVGIVLGSGLAPLVDAVDDPIQVSTKALPGYPESTVAGHEGSYYFGRISDVPVALVKGRIHGYEGYPTPLLGLPARVLGRLGCEVLIVTNAAGGIRFDFAPGDLMLIRDHMNLTGRSPLTGPNDDEFGPRFPDMTEVYPAEQRSIVKRVAGDEGLSLHEGVYAYVPGPQYETPAEVRMLSILGADAVGMSTVPECIAAAHMQLPVIGLSVIANRAAGLHATALTHEEVLAAVDDAAARTTRLARALIPALVNDDE